MVIRHTQSKALTIKDLVKYQRNPLKKIDTILLVSPQRNEIKTVESTGTFCVKIMKCFLNVVG